jgi:hypothetical protein
MKKIFTAFLVIIFANVANAQLANSSWTGTINAGGNDINILWKLTADSSFFYNNDDNSLLDVATYKVQDSTLTIKKVSGLSSCGEEEGSYRFVITTDEMKLYLLKDDCNDRSEVLDNSKFSRKQ